MLCIPTARDVVENNTFSTNILSLMGQFAV